MRSILWLKGAGFTQIISVLICFYPSYINETQKQKLLKVKITKMSIFNIFRKLKKTKKEGKAEKVKPVKEAVKKGKKPEAVKKEKIKKPVKPQKVQKPVKRKISGQAYNILVKPLVTEKATDLSMYNQYVFAVAVSANKVEVKNAIENIYGVRPQRVRIINMLGKKVRYGRAKGKTRGWKKAVVTLKQGDKIDVFAGV